MSFFRNAFSLRYPAPPLAGFSTILFATLHSPYAMAQEAPLLPQWQNMPKETLPADAYPKSAPPLIEMKQSAKGAVPKPPNPFTRPQTKEQPIDFVKPSVPRSVQVPSVPASKDYSEIDFGPYLDDLTRRIKRAWFPAKGDESKRVVAVFKIHKGGELSHLRLDSSSGKAIADQVALKAVENASPFRPLPAGSPDDVDIKFTFGYNAFGSRYKYSPDFKSTSRKCPSVDDRNSWPKEWEDWIGRCRHQIYQSVGLSNLFGPDHLHVKLTVNSEGFITSRRLLYGANSRYAPTLMQKLYNLKFTQAPPSHDEGETIPYIDIFWDSEISDECPRDCPLYEPYSYSPL